jgi:hypothetical protein
MLQVQMKLLLAVPYANLAAALIMRFIKLNLGVLCQLTLRRSHRCTSLLSAMQQPIYQHNWTGALALYVTSPAQPLLNPAAVKGISHNTKGSKGSWLKAASHARLRLVEHEQQHAGQHSITSMLELRLQENLLLQCPLLQDQLSLCIIPSSSTANSGSILMLRTKQQQQQQQQVRCQCMLQSLCLGLLHCSLFLLLQCFQGS